MLSWVVLNFIPVIYNDASQLTYSLIKNALLLVPTEKVLHVGFSKCLIKLKVWLSEFTCLLPNGILKKLWAMTTNLLIMCGYRIPQFPNFSIPPTWLSYLTTSKYYHPCYGFLTPRFQNFTKPQYHIFVDW